MHDKLFASQRALKPAQLREHAQSIGVDLAQYDQCMADKTQEAEIKRDMAEGQKVGVRGTPSFGLGYTDPKGSKVKVVQLIRGAQPYSAFKKAIDEMLTPPKK